MISRIFVLASFALATGALSAQAQAPTDELSAILEDKGETTLAAIRSELERQPRNAILNYVSNVVETRIFEGQISGLTPETRFAIVSDDGCTVEVLNEAGTTVLAPLLSNANNRQNVEGAKWHYRIF